MNSIRRAVNAGRFYDADASSLQEFVDTASHQAETCPNLRALVVPHAGYVYSGSTAGHAYSLIEPGAFERVILIGPSHYAYFEGVSVSPFDAYDLPTGSVPVDTALRETLLQRDGFISHPDAHDLEHCLEVQLPFIHAQLPNATILPIVYSQLDADGISTVARVLKSLWDEKTLLVISTDFTHYGYHFNYHPFPVEEAETKLPALDKRGAALIAAQDAAGFKNYLDETGATICGRGPLQLLLAMLDESLTVNLLEYTNSAQLSGDYNSCVGYVAMSITAEAPQTDRYSAQEKKQMLQVARDSILSQLEQRAFTLPDNLPASFYEPGSCFVTLRLNNTLRGCIGSLEAYEPLIENIAANAKGAAFRDTRFAPLQRDEFDKLEVHISVLTTARPVDGPQDIQIGRHGVILSADGRQSVFLPEVATEQGWDRETMLQHLSMKAGLAADAWKHGTFEVFESICFGDDDIS